VKENLRQEEHQETGSTKHQQFMQALITRENSTVSGSLVVQ